MSVKRMRPICRAIIALAICFGENGVGAKPVMPDYVNLADEESKEDGRTTQREIRAVRIHNENLSRGTSLEGVSATPSGQTGKKQKTQSKESTSTKARSFEYNGFEVSEFRGGVLDRGKPHLLNGQVCWFGSKGEAFSCEDPKVSQVGLTIAEKKRNMSQGDINKNILAVVKGADFIQSCKTDGTPGSNSEILYQVKRTGTGWDRDNLELRRIDQGGGTENRVKGKLLDNEANSVIATIHTHPKMTTNPKDGCFQYGTTGCRHDWPSEADVINALKNQTDCYIWDCFQQQLIRVDTENGNVFLVNENGEESPTEYRPENSPNAYDPEKFAEMKKAYAGKVEESTQNASVGYGSNASKSSYAIDTSTLEELLKKKVAFLESLLARGEPATNAQLESDNAVSQEYRAELEKVMKEIEALKISDEEKTKLFKEIEQKLQSDSKRLIQLMQQAVDEKLIAGVTFQSVNGITGTESESASDNGGCKCKNPSPHYIKVSDDIPAAVRCTSCGKTVGVLHHGKIIRTSQP